MVVVGACGRLVVVAHNTSNVGTTGDIGKTIAVDDAGCAIKQTYQAAGVACAANRAAQDADVVDAGSALGSGCYGAGVARTADANIFQHEILHCSGQSGEQRCIEIRDAVGHLRSGVDGGLKGTAERGNAGMSRGTHVAREPVIACGVGNIGQGSDVGLSPYTDACHQQCEEDENLSAKVPNLIGGVMLSDHIVGFRSFFFGSVFCL